MHLQSTGKISLEFDFSLSLRLCTILQVAYKLKLITCCPHITSVSGLLNLIAFSRAADPNAAWNTNKINKLYEELGSNLVLLRKT